MYVIRRVWKTKPRAAREAATIVSRLGELYQEAGRRSEVRVSFNGTTLPGESDIVFMEWTDDVIRSPYGRDEEPIADAGELGARLRELTDDSWIEFYEMMTPQKAMNLG